MLRKCLQLLLAGVGVASGLGAAPPAPAVKRVMVIPIRHEIAEPSLYLLRRGLKEAIAQKDDVVVLDLKTPGGALDVTFEMMEALEKFPGQTIAYVNNEAMSAGAFISAVTGEIWFAPDGIIGAAAPVTSTGQDVDATMKLKVVSYLKARMRAISEGKAYRGQVVSAMIDSDLELKIDGHVLKEKNELLSLTATEAMKTYGTPAQPLLGAGIAPDVDALLVKKFGAGGYTVQRLVATWSESLAVRLNQIAPALMGLGLLALFVAFKTGGFGWIGLTGIGLLAIVFLSHIVAGFSGHEPLLLFAGGILLLALELLFWHSAGFLGVAGIAMILGSLVWATADLWPNQPIQVAWSADAFARPLADLGVSVVIAAALGAALLRFLPSGWVWDRMVVHAVVGGTAQAADLAALDGLAGQRGVAATALRPAGQVEVGGRRYEAQVAVGTIAAGASVVVRGRADFGLIVEPAE